MNTVLSARHTRERAAEPAATLTLERRDDGLLWATLGDEARGVSPRLCFPWTARARYVSLRDEDEEEFTLVEDPAELDPSSRRALEQALVEAGFVLEVTRVLAVEEEVEVRHWRVETRQGPRAFQTRLDDWPRSLPDGGLLIRDVAGDLYHLADPAALDRKSRELLWAFLD
jgi:hypothetical protein